MLLKLKVNGENNWYFTNPSAKGNEVMYIETLDDHDVKLINRSNDNFQFATLEIKNEDDVCGLYTRNSFEEDVLNYCKALIKKHCSNYVKNNLKDFAHFFSQRLILTLKGENIDDYIDKIISSNNKPLRYDNDGLGYVENDYVYELYKCFEIEHKKNNEEYNQLSYEVMAINILNPFAPIHECVAGVDHNENVEMIKKFIPIFIRHIKDNFANDYGYIYHNNKKYDDECDITINVVSHIELCKAYYMVDENKDHVYLYPSIFDYIDGNYGNGVRCSANNFVADSDDPNYGKEDVSSYEFFRYIFTYCDGDFNMAKFIFEMINKYIND